MAMNMRRRRRGGLGGQRHNIPPRGDSFEPWQGGVPRDGGGQRPNRGYGGPIPPRTSPFGGGGRPLPPRPQVGPDGLPSFGPDGLPIGQGGQPPGPIRGTNAFGGNLQGQTGSFLTGAQYQARGGDKKWQRLLDQYRSGDNRKRITNMMMRKTNYDDGRPDTGEVTTWLRRQMMNAPQQDQQRIRSLTQGLGGKLADPYSSYNLAGQQWPGRGQGMVDELGGLLQDYPNYSFDWNTRGFGGNDSRASGNQLMGIGSPSDIWNELGVMPPRQDMLGPRRRRRRNFRGNY